MSKHSRALHLVSHVFPTGMKLAYFNQHVALSGRQLSGDSAVRCVPGGRSALHPLPGHCASRAPAAAAVFLRVCDAINRRRDQALQPGTTQVRRIVFIVTHF